ncbi:MAG: murein peptide amidase A [Gammaproteobacteria bacterium]|nr:murein peptide amidase A [Gammaproteobacteria bacterium]
MYFLCGLFLLTSASTETSLNADQACQKISNKFTDVSLRECNTLQLKPGGYNSVNNFPILIRNHAPVKATTPKGRVLLTGGTPGDEPASISVVFK